MSLQKKFIEFNERIRTDFTDRKELAEKRDILLDKLKESGFHFRSFNQGSYAMFTGVEPLDADYDIDVGIRLLINKDDFDPVEVKKKISDALDAHTEIGAQIKNPCVTIGYKKDGEMCYHVDLAIYAYEDANNSESQLYLARGKRNSDDDNKCWDESDPIELRET
ncbi:nucleotidyltransferase domain-containing protein [Anoxynatronum buryatiense]|uniref:Cyclic GMP-AMP synthase n=1 Tax=Anoxynatronum buryatiense TaxID=489973 RepID=A0AA46AKN4_9CLOT|nr:nucleotidyltransferase [Anoxynatronum buryatiense]SMP73201.1 hypothetical protein SAMN06296020_1433 [Anoxynatronum buryatiense]